MKVINRSETANLKLFKHDDPPNNQNKFDVEKALNQNWDKIDANAKQTNDKIEKTNKDFNTYQEAQTITNYRVIVDEIILANTEYTLPCEYIVGNDSLTIFYCNERLICEEEGKDGNYCEVGEKGNKSNKVKFGWDIKVGRIFDFVIKGVVANV